MKYANLYCKTKGEKYWLTVSLLAATFLLSGTGGSTQRKAPDSALHCMRRSLSIAQANSQLIIPSDIPLSAIGISNIFLEYFLRTKQYQGSIDYYKKIAPEESRQTPATSTKDLLADKFNIAQLYLGLAVAYEGKEDIAIGPKQL